MFQEARTMKTGLRRPHLTSNVQVPDGDPRYPLRERYRQTNYTVEGEGGSQEG